MSATSDVESICDALCAPVAPATPPTFSVTHATKKFMLVGCSHGQLALRSALEMALKFKADYKPDLTAHLGDFTDTTAWRSGAHDTKDEGASVADDMESGLRFLEMLCPDLVIIGNHEARIYKNAEHPNALIAEAARSTIANLREVIVDELGAIFVETYDLRRSWVRMGPALIGHGVFWNENAIRDHADFLAQDCVIAHLHRHGVERARTLGGATGYCVGYLGDRDKFNYAHLRKATEKWTVGFAYGEYCDAFWDINLRKIECPKTEFLTV
jgi:hypothetical protein